MRHREVLQKLNNLFPDKTYCGTELQTNRFPTNKEGIFDTTYTVWVHFYKPEFDELTAAEPADVIRIDSKHGCKSWDEAWYSFEQNYSEYKTQTAKLEVTECSGT